MSTASMRARISKDRELLAYKSIAPAKLRRAYLGSLDPGIGWDQLGRYSSLTRKIQIVEALFRRGISDELIAYVLETTREKISVFRANHSIATHRRRPRQTAEVKTNPRADEIKDDVLEQQIRILSALCRGEEVRPRPFLRLSREVQFEVRQDVKRFLEWRDRQEELYF